MDRVGLDYETTYTFSYEMRNEMWNELNRLIEKYEVKDDPIAIELVEILKGQRDELDVEVPTEPLTYEQLMGYHLAFPPFFPNQKPFVSDDDFFVRQHEEYFNLTAAFAETIIDRRRAMFVEEMEKKKNRKVTIKYYDAPGWTKLPDAGLSSLVPYQTGETRKIDTTDKYGGAGGDNNFARSGRADNVAILYEGYLHITAIIEEICITSDDGAKLFFNGMLMIDNDGIKNGSVKKCAPVSEGVYKLDLEFFVATGPGHLVLEYGRSGNYAVVDHRLWASVGEKASVAKNLS